MNMFKFLEESHVILAEHAQVFYHIFEVSNALNAHTKGIASVNLAVDTTKLKYIGSTMPQPKISTQPVCLQKP